MRQNHKGGKERGAVKVQKSLNGILSVAAVLMSNTEDEM